MSSELDFSSLHDTTVVAQIVKIYMPFLVEVLLDMSYKNFEDKFLLDFTINYATLDTVENGEEEYEHTRTISFAVTMETANLGQSINILKDLEHFALAICEFVHMCDYLWSEIFFPKTRTLISVQMV